MGHVLVCEQDLHDRVVQEVLESSDVFVSACAEKEACPKLADYNARHTDPLRAVHMLYDARLAPLEITVGRCVEASCRSQWTGVPDLSPEYTPGSDANFESLEMHS